MNASNPDPGTIMLDGETMAQKYIDELTAQGVNKVVLVRVVLVRELVLDRGCPRPDPNPNPEPNLTPTPPRPQPYPTLPTPTQPYP